MKITKRITTMLLIFVFAFTSLCTVGTLSVSADFSDVPESHVYSEAITSLVDEGIINGYEDGTFKPENTITRAEFSKLLAVSSAPTGYVFSATTTNFPDIANMSAEHGWAVPYISYAVSTKAINGYTDGTFQAGNPVTYGEAVKMIVCTLGYGPVVDTSLTPWYKGYIDIANQIGLSKKAMALGDSPASRGIVAQLIYNMLDCPQLVQTGTDINGNPIYDNSGSGNSFGDSKDNAQSDEGIVMGVTDYSLDGTAVGRNRVQIDSEIYTLSSNLSMESVKALIGYRVSYSYSGVGSKKELTKLSRLSGYNTEITLEPWQIDNVARSYIEYYKDENAENRGETEKISYNNFYVIYNGMPVNPSDIGSGFDVRDYFNVETGSIRLFSNDGNEKTAEVIFVESYETYFVNSPSNDNGITTIYDKNQVYTGLGSMAINEDDVASVTKVSSKGGKPATSTLGAITNKTVVSVAVPYGVTEGTKVIVSSAYVTGDVNGLSSDYENIVIGSDTYELSPYYQKLLDNGCPEAGFSLRDNAKFYLDYLGRIVYSEKNETADPYGLLVAFAKGSTMDSAYALKVMTTNGKYLEYNMKSSIRVDGTSMSSDEAVAYLKTKASLQQDSLVIQPIKYRVSGNQFTSIETIAPAVAKQNLTYSTSGYVFKDGSSTKFSMATSGTNATEVFVVPSDITNYDKYSNKAPGYFSNNVSYDVEAYELTGTNAKIVVCYLAAGQTVGAKIVASTPVYMIEAISDVSNDEGQLVKKITYRNIANTNESATKNSADDAELIAKIEALKSGDLVKFVTEDNEITDIKTVFASGALTTETGTAQIAGHHISRDGNNTGDKYYQVYYGTIYDQNDDSKQISVIPAIYSGTALDEGGVIVLTQSSDAIPFYKYNSTEMVFETASSGAIDKYIDFKDTEPTKASQAVIVSMNNKVVGVYLVNE
ncbi:MAG: S-layer homology domain-containing protein [Clostridia bacterium]|nr:S-layer homology domain-containing protein [Clostridia bacterium]